VDRWRPPSHSFARPMADERAEHETVLEFWFGALDALGRADDEHVRSWFKKDPAFDGTIRERFGALHASVARGERSEWCETPRGRLAAVIVLDQFSRNLFRGTARAFASDRQALDLASEGVARGYDRALVLDERTFLYMPYMHSEDLVVQERSVELFRSLLEGLPGAARDRVAETVDYAERHRDVIRRFGRFPHRNVFLDRTSTAEEIQFLKDPAHHF